jgi:hypothetical protein
MRPAAVVLAVAVLLSGCAQPLPLLKPGEDSSRLEAEVARRGTGEVSLEPAPPDSPNTDAYFDGMRTTYKVIRLCCILPLLFAVCFASHGGGSLHPDPNFLWPAD